MADDELLGLRINEMAKNQAEEHIDELDSQDIILLSDKNIPIPEDEDIGKFMRVGIDGSYELVEGNAAPSVVNLTGAAGILTSQQINDLLVDPKNYIVLDGTGIYTLVSSSEAELMYSNISTISSNTILINRSNLSWSLLVASEKLNTFVKGGPNNEHVAGFMFDQEMPGAIILASNKDVISDPDRDDATKSAMIALGPETIQLTLQRKEGEDLITSSLHLEDDKVLITSKTVTPEIEVDHILPRSDVSNQIGSEEHPFLSAHVNSIIGNLMGNASTATSLETARNIKVNLASTAEASFNGALDIAPGVDGILPRANGGTGNAQGKAHSVDNSLTIYKNASETVDFDGSTAYNLSDYYVDKFTSQLITGVKKFPYNTLLVNPTSANDESHYRQVLTVPVQASVERRYLLSTKEMQNPVTTFNENVYSENGKLFSNSSEVVNLSDAQTIVGTKTFKANTYIGTSEDSANLYISGNIYQQGAAYITEAEHVNIKDSIIYTRSNASSALGAGEYTGLIANKYNGTNYGALLYDNQGIARVGDVTISDGIINVSGTQPLATREERPQNGSLAYWDDTTLKFITNADIKVSNNKLYSDNKEVSTIDHNHDASYLKNIEYKQAADFAEQERQKSKNLLNSLYDTPNGYTFTNDGITYTINADGSITANGTATGHSEMYYAFQQTKMPAGTYTFSGQPTETNKYWNEIVYGYKGTTSWWQSRDKNSLTKTFDEEWYLYSQKIQTENGTTIDNITAYFQLEKGNVATSYQSYNGAIVHESDLENLVNTSITTSAIYLS